MQKNVHEPETLKSIPWEDQENETSFQNGSDRDSEFAQLFEEKDEAESTIREGSIVKGKVVGVSGDVVIIDIGHKAEGEVSLDEFKDDTGQKLEVNEGDEVEVYLDSFEDSDGELVLSRERAQILRAWDRIERAYDNNDIVEGTIVSRVKGGLSVDIGVKAFLPGSQVDLRPVKTLDRLIGQKIKFKIIKFNRKRGNIVLSHRVLLEQDREKLKAQTLEAMESGNVLKGVIKNITDYGAFVDLGGIDGLLHITDMSWGRISHPSQLFEIGQEIDVKVLSFDGVKQRVSLGYKQMQEDPWEKSLDRYQEGTRCTGKIVSLTDYGAFVELEEGVEGLIHVSELSWSKRVKHPSKVVQLGEEVEVIVLAIDRENRRISLGRKQIEPNPWDVVQSKYQVGDVIRGKIRNVTDFGVFVGIEEGVDGLIHVSDISWTEKIEHPAQMYKKGDEVEAKILQIDVQNERFSLGIKQLGQDPWDAVAEEFKPGTKHTGKVSKVADFGAFVELKDQFEGLIHVSELDVQPVDKPGDVVKEGDEVEFVVLAVDGDSKKISLSRKAHLQNLEGENLKEYISKAEPQTSMAEAFEIAQNNQDH